MDDDRFDTLTRNLASMVSRRGGMKLLAAGASLLGLARGKSGAAQEWYRTFGEPCWDSSQCVAADAPLVCADNGFGHDGQLNCCTYEGGRCYDNAHCCGTAYCDPSGRCSSSPSSAPFDARGVGDPCQTTEQCRRPQTGAICEYTVSTDDKRCCWYEGFCTSGAQCCGSRVCAGGVCQFVAGGSGMGGGGASGDWCGNKYCASWERCCNASCGICAPGGAACPDDVCVPCPGCDSGLCFPNGYCAP